MANENQEDRQKLITIVVFYQPDEVISAAWDRSRREYADNGVMLSFVLCVAAVALGLSMFFYSWHKPEYMTTIDEINLSHILVVSGCLIPFAASFLVWQLQKEHSSKIYKRQLRFQMPNIFSISPAGVQVQNSVSVFLAPWYKVSELVDLPEVIYFLIDFTIFPVPKRCFESQETLNAVLKLAIANKVPYSKSGKQPTTIRFGSSIPLSYEFDLKAEARDSAPPPSEPAPPAASPLPPPLSSFQLSPPHPDSSLLSEPIIIESQEQTLHLECAYTLEELRQADRILFFKYALVSSGTVYAIALLMVLIAVVVLTILIGRSTEPEALFAGLQILPLVIPFFFFSVRTVLSIREEARKAIIAQEQPLMIDFTEKFCRIRSRRYVLVWGWDRFIECLITKDFYICRLPAYNMVIPKRILKNRQEQVSLESLLKTNVKKVTDLNETKK